MRDTSLAFLTLLLAACAPEAETTANDTPEGQVAQADALDAALASDLRSADNRARDQYRHPKETLEFFGVETDDAVVEMWPGGGWYTEILASYLGEGGSLALVGGEGQLKSARAMAAAHPDRFENVLFSPLDGPEDETTFPAGAADVVLTFRNMHNAEMGDTPEGVAWLKSMYAMLRPGGTLGVVDHRLPEDRDDAEMKSSGYLKQSHVIALAEEAGFEFVESSEINANPLDTADHPEGVWTLPPRLALEDQDRDKYMAIGESDRMTLKFRKPE